MADLRGRHLGKLKSQYIIFITNHSKNNFWFYNNPINI